MRESDSDTMHHCAPEQLFARTSDEHPAADGIGRCRVLEQWGAAGDDDSASPRSLGACVVEASE